MTGSKITVFDLESKKVVGQLDADTPSSLAIDGKYLFVTNKVTDSITIFDAHSLTEIKKLNVGEWPVEVKLVHAK